MWAPYLGVYKHRCRGLLVLLGTMQTVGLYNMSWRAQDGQHRRPVPPSPALPAYSPPLSTSFTLSAALVAIICDACFSQVPPSARFPDT